MGAPESPLAEALSLGQCVGGKAKRLPAVVEVDPIEGQSDALPGLRCANLRGGRQVEVWPLAAAPDGPLRVGIAVRARLFLARHGLLLVSLAVMAALALLILRAMRRLPG